jgi:hypothetical protein
MSHLMQSQDTVELPKAAESPRPSRQVSLRSKASWIQTLPGGSGGTVLRGEPSEQKTSSSRQMSGGFSMFLEATFLHVGVKFLRKMACFLGTVGPMNPLARENWLPVSQINCCSNCGSPLASLTAVATVNWCNLRWIVYFILQWLHIISNAVVNLINLE